MKKFFVFMMFCCTMILLSASFVRADLITIGDPIEGNSWSQALRESGVGYFNHLQLKIISADDSFKVLTGISNFNKSGWSQTWDDGKYLIADGNSCNDLTFKLTFEGLKSNPLTLIFQAYDNDVLKESARGSWNGSKWTFTEDTTTWNEGCLSAASFTTTAPEPGTLILFGLGAFGLAGLRFRKRSRA